MGSSVTALPHFHRSIFIIDANATTNMSLTGLQMSNIAKQ